MCYSADCLPVNPYPAIYQPVARPTGSFGQVKVIRRKRTQREPRRCFANFISGESVGNLSAVVARLTASESCG